MTFEEACAALQAPGWGLVAALEGTPMGEVILAREVLEWAEAENEVAVEVTIAEARAELARRLARCSRDELAACLAVGAAGLREAALLALGELSP